MCEYLGYIWYILPRALSGAMPSDNLVRSVVLQNMPQLRPKKKLLDFSDIFFQKIDVCVFFIFTFIFQLGTFLDI